MQAKIVSVFCGMLIASFAAPAGADAVRFDLIFSGQYSGVLLNPTDTEAELHIKAYSNPEATAEAAHPPLRRSCVLGGGGDCATGFLYKERAQNSRGQTFYQVETELADSGNADAGQTNDVWVTLPEGAEDRPLDITVGMSGIELAEAEDSAKTDTAITDRAPSLNQERKLAWDNLKKMLAPNLSKLAVSFRAADAEKSFPVWPSYRDSATTSTTIRLRDLAPFDTERYAETDTTIQADLTVLQVSGSDVLVYLPYLMPNLASSYEGCVDQRSYFWLNMARLKALGDSVRVGTFTPPAPQEASGLLESALSLSGYFEVKEIASFNGREYARIVSRSTWLDPTRFDPESSHHMHEEEVETPHAWLKTHSDDGRLRFWFGWISC